MTTKLGPDAPAPPAAATELVPAVLVAELAQLIDQALSDEHATATAAAYFQGFGQARELAIAINAGQVRSRLAGLLAGPGVNEAGLCWTIQALRNAIEGGGSRG